MKMFKRKSVRRANSRPTISPDVGDSANRAILSHRLTRDLVRAEKLAQMLATSRAAAVVDVPDFLAGMYIYEWERLSRFWEEHDEIEELLQRICQISPQRWHRWIEFYDESRKEADKKPNLFFPEPKKSDKKNAEASAPLRRTRVGSPKFRSHRTTSRYGQRSGDSHPHKRVRSALHRVQRRIGNRPPPSRNRS